MTNRYKIGQEIKQNGRIEVIYEISGMTSSLIITLEEVNGGTINERSYLLRLNSSGGEVLSLVWPYAYHPENGEEYKTRKSFLEDRK